MPYQLIAVGPDSPVLWKSFHAIRKAELFTARGLSDIYRDDHPDDRKEGHYPLLYRCNCFELGVVRLDHLESPVIATAAIRLVAIKRDQQRKGHGREMMTRLERLAKSQGIRLLVVNAALESTMFYCKLGFINCKWKDPATGFDTDFVQMAKLLDHRVI